MTLSIYSVFLKAQVVGLDSHDVIAERPVTWWLRPQNKYCPANDFKTHCNEISVSRTREVGADCKQACPR